jgi:hypothetical protein
MNEIARFCELASPPRLHHEARTAFVVVPRTRMSVQQQCSTILPAGPSLLVNDTMPFTIVDSIVSVKRMSDNATTKYKQNLCRNLVAVVLKCMPQNLEYRSCLIKM